MSPDGSESIVDAALIQVGQILRVKPGESIPVDGVWSKDPPP